MYKKRIQYIRSGQTRPAWCFKLRYWNSAYVERGWCDGLISSFKENTEYTYQLYLKLTDEAAEQGYVFEPNTRLAVDCEYVEYPHLSETSVAMQIATNLTMTPTKSVEPKEIPVVEINNATLTFKDGEWTRSDEWFNDADHHGNYKDITAFDKNKTCNYNLAIFLNSKRADEGWYFGPNTKLKINGKEVSFTYIYMTYLMIFTNLGSPSELP